jgi:fructose/tagatose bisphosphate aldolase
MTLVAFAELMADAERGGYAVGYFESWSLESLLAVADAAEAQRSPVILGFSGIYLPHPDRVVHDPLAAYAALGRAVCEDLSVPACLLFNESPHLDWVEDAVAAGFGLVMYTDEELPVDELAARVRRVAERAHAAGVAVEGEPTALPGVGGDLGGRPEDLRLTSVEEAVAFVERTGVDALAVNVGQLHLHGRERVRLDLDRLRELHAAVDVPLVLHGASSVDERDLAAAVEIGVRKVNVGSVLKSRFLGAMRGAAASEAVNPYEAIGSGLDADVLTAGRRAVQETVESLMGNLGSRRRA